MDLIHRRGPVPYDEVIDQALCHPSEGFYAAGGSPGRHGDFLTSPEVGPLFGSVMARALDAWWGELGRPDPFVVVEAGAGAGTLARDILVAAPACSTALRYVLVERSPVLTRLQGTRVHLEPAAVVLGPAVPGSSGDAPPPVPGAGPVATALPELPAGPVTGLVIANELLDNLPFRLLERRSGRWSEVRVGERDGRLEEVLVPAAPDVAAEAHRLVGDVDDGARVPLQHRARAWLRAALSLLERGRVIVVDYADTTPSMARRPWREWVRTYRSHGPGGHPLHDPGCQDVTCEVAVDQLAHVRTPTSDRSQAEFLWAHGIDDVVGTAREAWRARAAVGDLAAVRARSRVTEAAALTDPGGLGAFRVLEWAVG